MKQGFIKLTRATSIPSKVHVSVQHIITYSEYIPCRDEDEDFGVYVATKLFMSSGHSLYVVESVSQVSDILFGAE